MLLYMSERPRKWIESLLAQLGLFSRGERTSNVVWCMNDLMIKKASGINSKQQ